MPKSDDQNLTTQMCEEVIHVVLEASVGTGVQWMLRDLCPGCALCLPLQPLGGSCRGQVRVAGLGWAPSPSCAGV